MGTDIYMCVCIVAVVVQSPSRVDSLQPHGLQHTRLSCPSPYPRVCPSSCPLNWWCRPTISSCCPVLLPSILPRIKVFSSESAVLIRWPKYWSFIFSIIPSNKYSGLISFRVDWPDLLAGSAYKLYKQSESKQTCHTSFWTSQLHTRF